MEGYFDNNIVHLTGEVIDIIPVIVSERLIDISSECKGRFISVFGQFRSFNKLVGDKYKLTLSLFAREIEFVQIIANQNEIYVRGYICKEPTYRKTPGGREISDVILAVNRAYGKSDYIPCVCWGRNARFVSTLEVGTLCEFWGRIQSREYTKTLENGETEIRTAYEVSVNRVEV